MGLGLLLLQTVVYPLGAGPSWDEAVYLTQTSAGSPAVYFDEHRSRGMVLLLSPVAAWGAPMVVVRLWVATTLAGLLVAAYWPWARIYRFGAPAAAVVLLSLWSSLYFSAVLYPNFLAALSIVGGAGSLVRALEDPQRSSRLVPVALWMVGAGLLRPSDAVLAGVGMAVVAVFGWRAAAVRPLGAAAVGGLVGVGVWLVEGAVRFGLSPVGLVTGAVERSTGGPSPNQLPLYLANLDGPLRCRAECRAAYLADPGWQGVPEPFGIWLAAVALLVVLGVVGSKDRRPLVLALVATVPLLWFYARSGSAVNQRYLLPVLGLVGVAAGAGVALLYDQVAASGRGIRRVSALLGLTLLVVFGALWGLGQGRAASEEMEASMQHRIRAEELARIVVERADGRPCAVAAQNSYPQIQYWSECLTVEFQVHPDRVTHPLGHHHARHDLDALAADGWAVFALVQRELPEDAAVNSWPSERIDSDVLGRYELFVHPLSVASQP
ncbi:MAG: hypothetical protein JJT89_01330 [Nitriliruptoraceae bacterium]|nr:hypothetical protein [Nitriliruptoraceae bacterium]